MRIVLNSLRALNFKGQKSFDERFEGNNAVITAENGKGKTTVYDMYLWLLFDKDSTGRSSFELRPLDSKNRPVPGLEVMVEANVEIDGVEHTLRKEHHEKLVKKQLRGFETLCWIDEVPKKVSDYKDYINSLIDEETFKLLTDLSYFNDDKRFHWTRRRDVLVDMAGKTGTPKGFDDLLAKLKGRDIDEYKSVLLGQKKRHEKDRDEINPRIDEIQRGLDEYVGTDAVDVEMLTKNRELINQEIVELDSQRQEIFKQEKKRQEKIERLNGLNAQKSKRESALENDTSKFQNLLDEKEEINRKVAEASNVYHDTALEYQKQRSVLEGKLIKVQSLRETRLNIRKVFEEETTEEEPPDKCPECKQKWPEDAGDYCHKCHQKYPASMLADKERILNERLDKIKAEGMTLHKQIKALEQEIEEQQAALNELGGKCQTDKKAWQSIMSERIVRFKEIDEAIKNREPVDFHKDAVWLQFTEQIEKAQDEIGPSVSEQLQEIDDQKKEKFDELEQVNSALAQSDRRDKDNKRISELTELEKELAQKIADIDSRLKEIQDYKVAQNDLIVQNVNSKFKHVEWKLFKERLNGETDEWCEAIFENGKPYSDCSTGEKLFMDIDIVNALSVYYDVSVTLFIDHAESMTFPIETTCQTIELRAQKNIKQLKVEVIKTQKRKAVA